MLIYFIWFWFINARFIHPGLKHNFILRKFNIKTIYLTDVSSIKKIISHHYGDLMEYSPLQKTADKKKSERAKLLQVKVSKYG